MIESSEQVQAASSRVFIYGGDIPSLIAAEILAGLGMNVMIFGIDTNSTMPLWTGTEKNCREYNHLEDYLLSHPNVHWIREGTLQSIRGFVGEFTVSIKIDNSITEEIFGALLFDGTCRRILKLEEWGIAKARGIIGLQESLRMWDNSKKFPKSVIFLLDMGKEDTPEATESVLRLAHRVKKTFRGEVAILCRNMRVSGEGVETLYRTARGDGVIIYKYQGVVSVEHPGHCLNISFNDEFTGIRMNLETDILVVAEETFPPETAKELLIQTGVETDTEGYSQTENVWMYPALTNRRGIFVAGGIHSAFDGAAAVEEAKAAALEVYDLIGNGYIITGERIAVVDPEKCAVCLTCLRSCPHGAVRIDGEKRSAEIVRTACYGCGICESLCPARAITLEGHTNEDVLYCIEKKA